MRLQTLPLADVLRLMEAAVPTRLVLLDACRNNPFTRTLARPHGRDPRDRGGPGLAKIEATAGTLIAYATAPDEVALDGERPEQPVHRGPAGVYRRARGWRCARC